MADVININETPLSKLKAENEELKEKNEMLVKQLTDAKGKMAGQVSVTEVLKIQLLEMEKTLTLYRDQITGMITNVHHLRSKIPTLDTRLYGTKTQDRPENQ